MLIDDFTSRDFVSRLGTPWQALSDQVMGGISKASLSYDILEDRACLRLGGEVRLENNGGFIQMALNLTSTGELFDASNYTGLRLSVLGNGENYSIHLRTADNRRPWQSYRSTFEAVRSWETIEIPFESFTPYRLKNPLDITRLRRIALIAIGRAFDADLAISRLDFYR